VVLEEALRRSYPSEHESIVPIHPQRTCSSYRSSMVRGVTLGVSEVVEPCRVKGQPETTS